MRELKQKDLIQLKSTRAKLQGSRYYSRQNHHNRYNNNAQGKNNNYRQKLSIKEGTRHVDVEETAVAEINSTDTRTVTKLTTVMDKPKWP